ncbi:MAG: hypothetical protein DMG71_19260 [Acidobacteria bacterium]|nr:MAG: hypothetical protein DMG71_19260 [Acidobacteriota bacterium]
MVTDRLLLVVSLGDERSEGQVPFGHGGYGTKVTRAAVGCRLLALGSWLLALGSWLLALGFWL